MTLDASASDQPAQRGTALANACATCHGPEGRSKGAIPPLVTMPEKMLRDSLRAFRNGERSGTVMNRLAHGLDEADIDAIAAYFTKRQRP
jgi:cytochrome subunit of sulfide dehydrogenase